MESVIDAANRFDHGDHYNVQHTALLGNEYVSAKQKEA